MPQIFVSYAHEDTEMVTPLVKQLKRFFNIWIDETGIRQGDDWYQTIESNLRQSAAILIFVSNQSKDRPWVLYEIEEARKYKIPCHPYLIDSVGTVPATIKDTQYLDGLSSNAFEKLVDALPQTCRIQGNQVLPPELLGTARKFEDLAKNLPETAYLTSQTLSGAKFGLQLIGLPLRLTRYHKIHLIGKTNDTFEPTSKVQLCVLLSGRTYRNYELAVAAANCVLTRPDTPLRLLLVEGPPVRDPSNDAGGYGLDPKRPDEWKDAFRAMKVALSFYPSALPQIFFNGPGVLLYPLGADRRDIAPFELFQLEYGKTPAQYERVLWHDLLFA